MHDLIRQIQASDNVVDLAREVTEAYRLTVSLERDMLAINLRASIERQLASDLHREIMFGLESRFAERKEAIDITRSVITAWVTMGMHELAKDCLDKLLALLTASPTEDAIRQRAALTAR